MYLIPSLSMRAPISAIFSLRPGALRASSSVFGGGSIRGDSSTFCTALGAALSAATDRLLSAR